MNPREIIKIAGNQKRIIPSVVLMFCLTGVLYAQQLAFPTAEGYGKYAVGGRGGAVYEVTTLNSSGLGSLGAAIGASGPRTIVFRVSGTIEGNFNIRHDNITIAGQTAPGDGICIKGDLGISANNVIVRYIRCRQNIAVNPESDAIGGRYHHDIIIDHVSASWSGDEVFSLYMNSNVTIQWCMITEACAKFIDGENTGHRFGGIWGNNDCTMHHNLIANNDSRNPRWASGCGYNDYRNNVIYNWGYNSCYGGEKTQTSNDFGFTTINMVANYYKPGPATKSGHIRYRIVNPSYRNTKSNYGKFYVAGNYVVGNSTVTADNWNGGVQPAGGLGDISFVKLNQPWPAMAIDQQTPEDAYQAVLAEAGCSFPKRDSVDSRIIKEVRTGTSTYGNHGIITTPSDVGGWPILHSTPAPKDSDHDGMPDFWETAHGLNPHNAADRNNVDGAGYTMLEEYLNSLAVQGDTALHVDDDAPNDPGPGDPNISDPQENGTVTHPFDSIQKAIAAADDGATILVNSGTYLETLDFLGKNLEVEGQSGLESSPVIDANRAGPVVRFTGGEDPNCSLSGFELTGGVGVQAGAVLIDGASPCISHCLIVGNRCSDPNSGVVYCRDSHSVFEHCTVSGNAAGPDGAAFRLIDSNAVITNSIVWGNGPQSILVEGDHDSNVSYCDIQGGRPGAGNIDDDPLFAVEGYWSDPNDPNVAVDPNRADAVWIPGDYHLRSLAGWWNSLLQIWIFEQVNSPCIDAGNPGDYVSAEPEPNGSRVNLGAYGGTLQASRTIIYRGR